MLNATVSSNHASSSVGGNISRREAAPNINGLIAELFTPHGIWGPGVKLFRSIGFTTKALLISFVFFIPLLYLLVGFLSTQQAIINKAEQQIRGVAYMQTLIPLLKHAQLLRNASLVAAGGGNGTNSAEISSAYKTQQKRLEEIDAKVGKHLLTAGVYKQYLDALSAATSGTGSAEAVMAAHTPSVEAVSVMIDHVFDSAQLVLDSNFTVVYLSDATMVHTPELIRSLSNLVAVGNLVLQKNSASSEHTQQLQQHLNFANVSESRLNSALAKVVRARPDLAAELLTAENIEAIAKTKLFLESVRRTFLSGQLNKMDQAEFQSLGNSAIHSQFAADEKYMIQIEKLLVARISAERLARNFTISFVLICLLLAAYFFKTFHLVALGGLNELQRHLSAIAGGDLTTHPMPRGSDEAAKLMGTLVAMQKSLRNLVNQVRVSSNNISQSSNDIANGTLVLSDRTRKTAANLESSAAAVEEIAVTVRNAAQSAQEAATLAANNSEVADQGGAVIGEVVDTMNKIHASSKKIRDIIGVIDSIAFQTNILALNAAVEAARAGDHGRGFAVVAAEVRSLAQRSAAAAQEIKILITASVAQVESGSVVAQGAGEAIVEIVANADSIKLILDELAVGSAEQATGISQIGVSMTEIDSATQKNTELVEDSASAAGALKAQAERLADSVSLFKLPATTH